MVLVGVGGGGSVGTAWTLPTAKSWSACLAARGHSWWVLFWPHREQAWSSADSNLTGEKWRSKKFPQMLPLSPRLSYPCGSVSMSGIYQDLPRWVQACLCLPEIALYNLRNVDERCLVCPRWAREMDNVCYKWCTHTHTHTQDPHPPLSPTPDDPLVSMILSRGTLVMSCSLALF